MFGFLKRRKKRVKKGKKSYNGANSGAFPLWRPASTSADVDIKRDLRALRDRSRDLMRNDDYAKRFKNLLQTNVVGFKGARLQLKVKDRDGNLDKTINSEIEEYFREWGKKGSCDVTGKYSWIDIQKIAIATVAEDGEVLIRLIKGFPNRFGFALQLIEADHLDEQFNDPHRNIVMGIEYNDWGRPIAYWLYKNHPGSRENFSNNERVRIDADEILHLFIPTRISGSRGIPWMHTAITRLKMTGGYEEAELVAARLGAAKGGFFVRKSDGDSEYYGDTKDENGNFVNEITPGEFEILPDGYTFEAYDPKHPNNAFKDFMKVVLRGVASGLNINYNTLTNDLESVNFSSLRSGKIDERDAWKMLQYWLSEHLHDRVFSVWLEMFLLKGISSSYGLGDYNRLNKTSWLHRGFDWVDPYKDMLANVLAHKEGLKTHAMIANEMGYDLEELYEQLAKERELREKYEITTLSEAEIIHLMKSALETNSNE